MPMNPRLLRPRTASGSAGDSNVVNYIAAVELADGQPLEQAVKDAIRDFILGCKTDNIWSAIKSSCILMGARTLSGALTPLAGAAPTNNGFVSADYSRKTGLIGNGSTKFLATNRANNADPRNSRHLSVHVSEGFSTQGGVIGSSIIEAGASWIFTSNSATTLRLAQDSSVVVSTANPTGFLGVSRADANNISYRMLAATTTTAASSTPPSSTGITLFSAASQFPNSRVSFYSIGESLSLSLLGPRVATLYTAIGAAIP